MQYLIAVLATLALALPASAQSVGASVGAFYRTEGGHPHLHFAGALRGEVGRVGVEFLHAATIANRRPLDLFAYRATYRQPVGPAYLLIGAGPSSWRQWVCLDGSCGAVPTDGQKFASHRGLSLTAGLGVVTGATRAAVRVEQSAYGGVDYWLEVGLTLGD